MKVYVSPYAAKKYRKLVKTDPKLRNTLDKKLKLVSKNPNHPSLRLHKLSSRKLEEWSISVKGNLRMVFSYTKDGICITDIGSHDEVY